MGERRLLLTAVLLLLALAVPVTSEVSGVYYVVTYSVVDDEGFLTVTVNVTGADCAVYYVPVRIFNDREIHIEFLNYTATGTTVLGVDYRAETGVAEIATCNPGVVELVFAVSGLLEEQGAGAYSLVVDTSALTNMGLVTLELRLGIPVEFEVQVGGNLSVSLKDTERGVLVLRGLGVGVITIVTPVETPVPEPTPTPTPQPAVTPVPTPQPAVTPAPQLPLMYIVIAVIIVVVVIAVALTLRRRK